MSTSDNNSDYQELAARYEILQRRCDELERRVKIVDQIVESHRERWARARAFQVAATAARNGGPSVPKLVADLEKRFPIAHDIGDLVDELIEAVAKKSLAV